jgi:hypothetical protein
MEKIYIFGLNYKDGPLNLLFPFLQHLRLGSEALSIPFGSRNENLIFLFSGNSFMCVCPTWNFIF